MDDVGNGFILIQDIINVYSEWLSMPLIQLQDAETEMNSEWNCLVGLIKQDASRNKRP